MTALKHIHMTLAIITILGFLLRSVWLFRKSPMLTKKWVKITPHVIDTLLLLSGVLLLATFYGWTVTSWLAIKLLLIVVYIGFGIITFKTNKTSLRGIAFTLAIISFASILYLARIKPILW
ncbi:SirB2 family protein [Kangiella sediminilitoris]|uniref:Invasion gene expression up-regulator SirB n=1 Tax=Kangiella sediminilitoris TaxID=1144748 RepID=A0A1B3B7H5_9GAMM|nr:SirB2 family protein [Kangiella sediminilitoris]AOE48741.1 Invasion gene expression up-regulator SirB [Kangiella sediminilitoris]